jgi:hypothetical protein
VASPLLAYMGCETSQYTVSEVTVLSKLTGQVEVLVHYLVLTAVKLTSLLCGFQTPSSFFNLQKTNTKRKTKKAILYVYLKISISP